MDGHKCLVSNTESILSVTPDSIDMQNSLIVHYYHVYTRHLSLLLYTGAPSRYDDTSNSDEDEGDEVTSSSIGE